MMNRRTAFELGCLDAHDQAALLSAGEVSVTELVEAAIVRIEHFDPSLNVMTIRAYEQARAAAASTRAPSGLSGVPYLLKESLDYPGLPTRSASRSRLDSPNVTVGYEYVRRLDAAGLIPLGKTNTPEFSLLPTTEPVLYGPTRNPWAIDRSPGGSSGGAAVAVASGMVPLAHAADGGGSIRIPASCCGVFGLKPGRGGNVRARGHHIVEDILVGDVLISRSVRDAAWAVALASAGGFEAFRLRPPVRRLRIGLAMNNLYGQPPHPEVARVIARTAELCANLGHIVEPAVLPVDGAAVARSFRTIWAYLANDIVASVTASAGSKSIDELLEPWTLDLARSLGRFSTADLEQVFEQVARALAGLDRFFETCDVVLSPVQQEPPLAIGRLSPTRPFETLSRDVFEYIAYTPLQNLAGVPAMSVPLFLSEDGLPIGSMFTAARGGEPLLLQLAFELELARPWEQRWPGYSVGAALTKR